ncbi:MAG TPA: DUF4062 domain-containing protein [Solirubrobacteraceae bacterium]|nr:DUF4062 domain-containing protein [Solirubrobacteraceae bacterium]
MFISSLARGDMAAVRTAARAGVESLQMRPVMFETAAASREDSRRALLDELGRCDIVVLLLGAEYGERTERGVSATEDEFNEAVTRSIPVVALVQNVERSPEQDAFVARVRGTWSDGRFAPEFTDAADVGFAVVSALNAWRHRGARSEHQTVALERARTLAVGSGRAGQSHSGSKVRVVFAPVAGRVLIDAVMLGEAGLVDDLGMSIRMSGLVGHDMAMTHRLTADGVEFEAVSARGFERLHFLVAKDGAILAEGAVSGTGVFGSSVIEAPRVRRVIEQGCAFAHDAWGRIDRRDDVRELAATVAVPDASMKVYSDSEFTGSSLSMGSMFGSPPVVVAPDPPLTARREELGAPELVERLAAEVRQAFVLAGRSR